MQDHVPTRPMAPARPEPAATVPMAGRQLGDLEIVDVGMTRWVIDHAGRRFQRLPRDVDPVSAVLELPWSQYDRSHDVLGELVLWLDRDGRHRIRIVRDQPPEGSRKSSPEPDGPCYSARGTAIAIGGLRGSRSTGP